MLFVCPFPVLSNLLRNDPTDPQVLTALSDIHRLNLVHCDLMPESVV